MPTLPCAVWAFVPGYASLAQATREPKNTLPVAAALVRKTSRARRLTASCYERAHSYTTVVRGRWAREHEAPDTALQSGSSCSCPRSLSREGRVAQQCPLLRDSSCGISLPSAVHSATPASLYAVPPRGSGHPRGLEGRSGQS